MEKKEFAPSKVTEIKRNKKGKEYFMFGGIYFERFTSKAGKEFFRYTILPENENFKKNQTQGNAQPSMQFKAEEIPF